MSLYRAVIYRLFAGTGRPKASLRLRTLLLGSGLALLAGLTAKVTPHLAPGYSAAHILAWQLLLGSLFVTFLFLLGDGYQRTFMARLDMTHYLPISQAQAQRLSLLAYVPFSLLVAAIVMPALCKAFAGQLPLVWLAVSSIAFCFIAIACNVYMRIAGGRLSGFPQASRAAVIVVSVLLLWQLAVPSHRLWGAVLAAGLGVGQLLFTIHLAHKPLRAEFGTPHTAVWERHHLNIATGLALRAVRNGRYFGANVVLVVILLGLGLLAKRLPEVLPFDAVMMLVLLLSGTFGQEARTLSRRRYPIELVQYGLVGKWLRADWALAFANALLYVGVCIVVAAIWFPQTVSVSYWQVWCMGASLLAGAVLAGSLVVPQKQDILAQFASTAVYAGLAWLVIRTFARQPNLGLTTVAVIAASFGLSYAAEKLRWNITIGKTKIRR